MRIRTLVLIIVVLYATGAPALAQPFGDVPPAHWAYGALTELAAKGLIEGYPDGAFKGDRAMTRYEMALVVARLLARIERLQRPPTPTGPAPRADVTKADLVTVQRLVSEFRAELAAAAVRVAAIEEELKAIKARFDQKTVQVTGALRFRYDIAQAASGDPLAGNGNPNTGSTEASRAVRGNQPLLVGRLAFDGSVTPDVHAIFSVMTNNFFTFSSASFGAVPGGANNVTLIALDNLFFDWQNAFGWPLEIWLGRFGGGGAGGDTSIGKTYPVQFGPSGLLLSSQTNVWIDTTGNSNANVVDGLRVALHLEGFADLQMQGILARIIGNVGGTSYASGEDAYGLDANIRAMDGLRVGGYLVGNTIGQFGSAAFAQPAGALSAFYHVYGPAGGSLNPVTARCPAATGGVAGITCPALGNGTGAYVRWDVVPSREPDGEPLIHLDAEWAQWNDRVLGGSDGGYNVVVSWDLGSLLGVGHALALTTGYQYYGTNFYPPYGNAVADGCCLGLLYPGNAQGPVVTLSVSPIKYVTLYANFIGGNTVSNRQAFTEYEAGIIYKLAASSTITVLYRDLRMNNVGQANVLRAQLDYSF